jgi:hypothetical protein
VKNTQLSYLTVNAQADALARLLDAGWLLLYGGIQPARSDDPITDQVLLARLRIGDPSAPAALLGVLTFAAVAPEQDAPAMGVATWARATTEGGAAVLDQTVVPQGQIGNITLGTVLIQQHATVFVNNWRHTVPRATAGV